MVLYKKAFKIFYLNSKMVIFEQVKFNNLTVVDPVLVTKQEFFKS